MRFYWLLANENLRIPPKPATLRETPQRGVSTNTPSTLPLDLVLHHLAHYKQLARLRAEVALENKTGLVKPAPPRVDTLLIVYTRATFSPTSPPAPVPLLTYVKE